MLLSLAQCVRGPVRFDQLAGLSYQSLAIACISEIAVCLLSAKPPEFLVLHVPLHNFLLCLVLFH